jgi:uncharacterized iron-regulated protein
MMYAWFISTALGATPRCTEVGIREITSIQPPHVLVLGERHGTQPDLRRALRVVRRLARKAPVTVALEAVHESGDSTLQAFARGELPRRELASALHWQETWGFPWGPYRPLVHRALRGDTLVAAGPTLESAPDDANFPVPSGYFAILSDAMAQHPVPPAFQDKFVRSMAWRDYRIAESARRAWNGEGFLVVVTGRGHVEGGKGVPWQLAKQTQAPVTAAILARGVDAPCYAGDRIWTVDPMRDLGIDQWFSTADAKLEATSNPR